MEQTDRAGRQMIIRQALVVSVAVFVMIIGASAALFAREPNFTASADAGRVIDVSVSEWSVQAPSASQAGTITFRVTNNGTMPHELLVLQTDTPAGDIPLTDAGDPPMPVATGAVKVSEDTSVGETGGDPLVPGEARTFTVELTPGKYVLLCNIDGHYANGMRKEFTVL